jgi:hypothetical protein
VTLGSALVGVAPCHGESRTSHLIADSFDDVESGRLPARWAPIGGVEREWAVLPDLTAPSAPKVVANIWVGAENGVRSMLIRTDCGFTDGTISVRLKPMGGLRGQAAGAVWRYQAPDKYWFAKLDFAESTIGICVVKGGTPECVEQTAELDAMSWSTLTVNFLGRHVRLALDAQPHIETEGHHDGWPGEAGLWSAASSVTFFDDFQATESVSK